MTLLERKSRSPGRIEQGGDCDDNNVERSPGATEICNAVDGNCNGEADDGLEPGLYWPAPRRGCSR